MSFLQKNQFNLPLGVLDISIKRFQEEGYPIRVIQMGQPEKETALIWQHYTKQQGEVNEYSILKVASVEDCEATKDALTPSLTLVMLYVCDSIDITTFNWRQLLCFLQQFRVVVATFPESWIELSQVAELRKYHKGYIHVRPWSDLANTTFSLDQAYLTTDGEVNDLQFVQQYWQYIRFFENINHLKSNLEQEKNQLIAVKTVLSFQLKNSQSATKGQQFIERIKQLKSLIVQRFEQLEQYIRQDWAFYFVNNPNSWMQEVKVAIEEIATFPLHKKDNYYLLFIGEDVINTLNGHIEQTQEALITQFEVYKTTSIALCEMYLKKEKIIDNEIPKPIFNNASKKIESTQLATQIFKAQIPKKGIMQLLMSMRRAPMYFFMFFSMLAMSGVSIYMYRDNHYFQVLFFSIIILGALYAWYQEVEQKNKAIAEQTSKAKAALYSEIEKISNQFLANSIEAMVEQPKNILNQYLASIEQKLRNKETEFTLEKQSHQRFLEASIRAKNEQEKQIESALRRIDSLIQKEQRDFSILKQTIRKKTINNGTRPRINTTKSQNSKAR